MWTRKRQNNSPPPAAAPADDLAALGAIVHHNHIAYVPSRAWSCVPGVGTGNLAYAPDFSLSAHESLFGNAMLRRANAFMLCVPTPIVVASTQILEGIGGLTAGQTVMQPLLEVIVNQNANLGATGSE